MDLNIIGKLNILLSRGERILLTYSHKINEAQKRENRKNNFINLVGTQIPHGLKGMGKKILKGELSQKQHMKNIKKEAARAADNWLYSITDFLKNVSKETKNLNGKGNSSTLISKFNSAKSAVRFDIKIRRGMKSLEQLKNYQLIYNKDIKIQQKESPSKRAPNSKYYHFQREVKFLLKDHPSALNAFLGAVERLEKRGIDANRQALFSCRNSLEILVRSISNEHKWSEGIKKVIKSSTKIKTAKTTYGFLCGYGVHSKIEPTINDVKSGIEQTLSVIRFIISDNKG